MIVKRIADRHADPARARALVERMNRAMQAERTSSTSGLLKVRAQITEKQALLDAITLQELTVKEPERLESLRRHGDKLIQELKALKLQEAELLAQRPLVGELDAGKVAIYARRLVELIDSENFHEYSDYIKSFVQRLEFNPDTRQVTLRWWLDPVKDKKHPKQKFVVLTTGVGGGT